MEEAVNFARQRGDFDHPTFLQLQASIPSWLLNLGTEDGRAKFETEYSVSLPPALKSYFQHPQLATVIEGGCDVNTFLNQMADCLGDAPPYVLYHDRHAHLVVAFHNHSGSVCAVDVDASETVIRFGDADLANYDLYPLENTPVNLEEWVVNCIHHANLDLFPYKSRSYPVVPE